MSDIIIETLFMRIKNAFHSTVIHYEAQSSNKCNLLRTKDLEISTQFYVLAKPTDVSTHLEHLQ